MGMPMLEGLRLVHNTLVGLKLRKQIRLGASGKIISGFDVMRTLALGADWCNSARGFMFALGCIQAQTCHTGNCPTGVTTQDPKRQVALVVPSKADRVRNFHRQTLESVQEMLQATGLSAPSELRLNHIMRRVSEHEVQNLSDLILSVKGGALLDSQDLEGLFAQYWHAASPDSFQLTT
jgi:glutamate synthase domain-containing protein 2